MSQLGYNVLKGISMRIGLPADLLDFGSFKLVEEFFRTSHVGRHPVVASLIVSAKLARHQLGVTEDHQLPSLQDFGVVQPGDKRFILSFIIGHLEAKCQGLLDDKALDKSTKLGH